MEGFSIIKNDYYDNSYNLTAAQKLVLLAIQINTNDINIKYLEKFVGVSPRTLTSVLKFLEDNQVIHITRENGKISKYKINDSVNWFKRGITSEPQQNQNIISTKIAVVPNKDTSKYTKEFETIWSKWPKRDAKKASYREYLKWLKSEKINVDYIYCAVDAYLFYAKQNPSYPKYVHSLRTAISDNHLTQALDNYNQLSFQEVSFEL
ncbi:MAG: hypothetical protein ACK41T_00815 [Pseudobdellovibrio sp.]